MAGENTALSREEVQSMITSAIKPLTEGHTKITGDLATIVEALKTKPAADPAPQAQPAGAAAATAAPAGPTLEQIGSLIDSKLTAFTQSTQSKAARDSYIGDKLKDLPAVYRDRLGNDPAKWATEEQTLRDQYKADLKAVGAEPKSLGNASNDGGTTPERKPVDRSQMSPMDLLNSDAKRE